jgi:hypothetical protein
MNKLLIILRDNTVSYAKIIDGGWVERATDTFPYRTNDDDGNPYARALRQRDHNINRGTNLDVLVLDEDDPEKYYFKKYNPVTKEFFLYGMTEEERDAKVANVDAFFGIAEQRVQKHMRPNDTIIKKFITEDKLTDIINKLRLHEPFTDDQVNFIESNLSNLPEKERDKVIFAVASHYSRICIDPIVGVDPVDRTPEHRSQWSVVAIYWWNKLIGTSMEKFALKETARICAWTGQEERAVQIHNDLLERNDLTENEKRSIRRRIVAIGSGRSIYNEAINLYNNSNFDGCIAKLDEFGLKSSGAVKTFLAASSSTLRGKCLIGKAKLSQSDTEKQILKEMAIKLIYPER